MMKPTNVAEKANRQCWECLKRRLVCDFTLPHCKKCLKAGRQCSGYDEKKPLQWMEPGQVLSRKRRKVPSKHQGSDTRAVPKSGAGKDSSSSDDNSDDASTLAEKYTELATTATSDDDADDVLTLAARINIELVVSEQRHDEAQKILKKAPNPATALQNLERLLRWIEREDIPTYNLRSDASEAVQAVHYVNTHIRPQALESSNLAPNPHNVILPIWALHALPQAVHHIVVCVSLNHFIYSRPVAAGRRSSATIWDKVFQHRGAAIRELTHSIGKEKTRCSDTTMSSVLMFLAAELQSQSQSYWRTHALGLMQLFEMRGGMMALYRRSLSHLRPTIVIFVFIVTFANSSSPAATQLLITPSLDTFLADVSEMYIELFPYCLCPSSLFQEIIRINYLRHEASQTGLNYEDRPDLTVRAHESLARIEEFDPRDWAQPGAHFDEWLTIGSVYKHTLAVYCIASLSSLALFSFPSASPSMGKSLSSHGTLLLHYTKAAFQCTSLRRYLVFSLITAGVEAIHRGDATRRWIEEALTELGQFTGTNAPTKARAALRRYWQKGEPGWEECFDQAYGLML